MTWTTLLHSRAHDFCAERGLDMNRSLQAFFNKLAECDTATGNNHALLITNYLGVQPKYAALINVR